MLKQSILTKLVKLVLFFILILIVVYMLFDMIIMPAYTRHGKEITVPDLTSMFYEDARHRLSQLGLEIVEEEKKFDTSNQFPIGVVMSQNPPPFAKVKKGRRIYVIVSKGEPTLEMPQLIHRSERNAIFILEKLGLKVGKINYEHSDIFHAGEISNQSIPPGTELKPGTVVDITVSLGLFPDKYVVPNLVGRSLNDARKIILQSGLTLGEVSFQIASDLLPGTIISQSPAANQKVAQGDTINLLVSKLLEQKGNEQ